MNLRSMIATAGAVVVAGSLALVSVSLADDAEAIKMRREHMKSVGGAAKVIGAMLEGKEKFDAAKAGEAATTIAMVGDQFGKDFDKLFPATAKEGGDSTAAPAIWEKPDDFKKLAMALNADAAATATAAGQSEDAFKAAAGKMFGNCKSCHEVFRVMK